MIRQSAGHGERRRGGTDSNQTARNPRFSRSSLTRQIPSSTAYVSSPQMPSSCSPPPGIPSTLKQSRGPSSPLKPTFQILLPRSSTTEPSTPYNAWRDRTVLEYEAELCAGRSDEGARRTEVEGVASAFVVLLVAVRGRVRSAAAGVWGPLAIAQEPS